MGMNGDEVILAATGYILTAEPGTAAPSETEIKAIPDTIPDDWANIGHTSRDDLPAWSMDGGDNEVKGTWQNASFRSVVTETPTETLTFTAHQVNREILSYYTGRGDGNGTDGTPDENVYHASAKFGQNPERALLIVVIDGARWCAFWAPRVSISRDDDLELDSEEFMAFPLKATFLEQDGMPFYDWISPKLDAEPDPVTEIPEGGTGETEPAGAGV